MKLIKRNEQKESADKRPASTPQKCGCVYNWDDKFWMECADHHTARTEWEHYQEMLSLAEA